MPTGPPDRPNTWPESVPRRYPDLVQLYSTLLPTMHVHRHAEIPDAAHRRPVWGGAPGRARPVGRTRPRAAAGPRPPRGMGVGEAAERDQGEGREAGRRHRDTHRARPPTRRAWPLRARTAIRQR